jgi:hypothetical protein
MGMSGDFTVTLPILLACVLSCPLWAAGPVSISGKVSAKVSAQVSTKTGPLEGAYVAAHVAGKAVTTYVMTDAMGQYSFRNLAPGSYTVFTRIPGFRTVQKDSVSVQAGKVVEADFHVEPETRFSELIEQASNSDLMDSFPLSPSEKQALDHRCADCHGVYYIAKSRFSLKDWELVVASMDDQAKITPAGDVSPPTRMARPSQRDAGSIDDSISDKTIAALVAKFRGPESRDFPIQFRPRATGKLTRAVVTEYRIPRIGATPRAVLVDPQGRYIYYSDWRANFLGRIDPQTGEIKEYPIPGVDQRPPGFQYIRWDPKGQLLAGQIWSGRGIRFDVVNEKVSGIWGTPLEWARTGSLGVCRSGSDGAFQYLISDGLARQKSWFIDPETGKLTEIKRGNDAKDRCDNDRDYNGWHGEWSPGGGKRVISYRDPDTGEKREFTVPSQWSRPYNAVGDPVRKVGWSVPDVTDVVVRTDPSTGEMTEFPLPSHGKEVRNIDIQMSVNPPALWFVNQRLGRIVRFQEDTE